MKKFILFLLISILCLNVHIIAQIPTNGLIAYYPFSGNANDMSGNGYNGTVMGASLITDRFGIANSAYSFNGTSDYIDLSNYATNLNFAQPASISFWVWTNVEQSQTSTIFCMNDGASSVYGSAIFIGDNVTNTLTDELITAYQCSTLPNYYIAGYTTTNRSLLFNSAWHHIVCVYNDTVAKIYLDNIQYPLTCNWGTNNGQYGNLTTAITAYFGARYNGGIGCFLKGKLDDVRIYNRVLNSADINTLFNEGVGTAIASPTTICSGTVCNLNANIGNGIIRWWDAASGGTMLGTSALGANFTVTPTATTTYYAEGYSVSLTTPRISVTVAVNSVSVVPTSASGYPNIINPGTTSILAITGGNLGVGANWNWYTGSCGGSYFASGAFIPLSPSATTTYWLRAEGLCNTTNCVSTSIVVNPTSVTMDKTIEHAPLLIYPNPANDIITINYSVANNELIIISIYNVYGEKLSDIVNSYQNKGTYNKEVNLSSIPSGVYIIKMNVGNTTIINYQLLIIN